MHSSRVRKRSTLREWARDLFAPVASITIIVAALASLPAGPAWMALRAMCMLVLGVVGALTLWPEHRKWAGFALIGTAGSLMILVSLAAVVGSG